MDLENKKNLIRVLTEIVIINEDIKEMLEPLRTDTIGYADELEKYVNAINDCVKAAIFIQSKTEVENNE